MGDRVADIVWRNPVSGKNVFWEMPALNPALDPMQVGRGSTTFQLQAGANWEILAVADFDRFEILSNGAGVTRSTPDILWRDRSTGALQLWLMDYSGGFYGRRRTVDLQVSQGIEWDLASNGDFNLDGHTDLMWLCNSSACTAGRLELWSRQAPTGQIDEPRPSFAFAQTCTGDLSYVPRPDHVLPLGCTAELPDCVDFSIHEFGTDVADCAFPNVPSTIKPFDPH